VPLAGFGAGASNETNAIFATNSRISPRVERIIAVDRTIRRS
jgi:hypothetical protein